LAKSEGKRKQPPSPSVNIDKKKIKKALNLIKTAKDGSSINNAIDVDELFVS
jgi:hypothetical protein